MNVKVTVQCIWLFKNFNAHRKHIKYLENRLAHGSGYSLVPNSVITIRLAAVFFLYVSRESGFGTWHFHPWSWICVLLQGHQRSGCTWFRPPHTCQDHYDRGCLQAKQVWFLQTTEWFDLYMIRPRGSDTVFSIPAIAFIIQKLVYHNYYLTVQSHLLCEY